MSLPLPESDLRGLIREVLRELVREEVARALGAAPTPRAPEPRAPSLVPARVGTSGMPRSRTVVTERVVEAAARTGETTLTVARGTAVTPLARDRARRLGIRIEKE